MRPRRDADRPRIADVVVDRFHVQIVVEHLDASVAAVADIDVAVGIHRHRVRQVQLAASAAARPSLLDESSVLVELHDARVAISIGHEDIPRRIKAHVSGPAEDVWLWRRFGCSWSVGREPLDRLGPPADHHRHAAVRRELDHHVRTFIDRPDVVLAIDSDRMREFEPVQALADLAYEGPVLIELEQSRVAAARIDEDVALGIRRNSNAFAEIKIGWKLQEVWYRLI